MRKRLIVLLLVVASTLGAQPQQGPSCTAANCGTGTTAALAGMIPSQFAITIENPSFEAPVVLPETFNCGPDFGGALIPGPVHLGRVIPGWNQSAGAGQIAYPYGVIQWACLPQQQFRVGNPLDDSAYLPPDGQNVAFIGNKLSISQDLGVPLQAGTYVFKYYIANWGYNYPGKLKGSILVGLQTDSSGRIINPGHELCSSDTWALGAWTQVSLPCSVSGYLAYNGFGWSDFGNGHVGIAFQHSEGWIVLLDETSLVLTAPAFVHN